MFIKMAAPIERKSEHTASEHSSQKRKKDGSYIKHGRKPDKSAVNVNENSAIIAAFSYQKELDEKHDKYERLVKLSRDVTIESKRVIFLLHRISSEDTCEAILKEADEKICQIGKKLKGIAVELEGEDPYRFLRAYTNGLQEYIEAISFYEYILNKQLLTMKTTEEKLTFKVPITKEETSEKDKNQKQTEAVETRQIQLQLPPVEYVLGLADLTGELMRYCINSIGHGNIKKPFELVSFMREIYEGFSLCSASASRELKQKMETMRRSLRKVENTCYTLQVRGSEIPKHMLMDAITAEPQTEEAAL
ncbi:translin-associated protein X-like isoform X2 [Anneissia japonica]|uniref:translin-associated protein X-like isoform X2 n=1 Tax=Anneissia japonica TaxID=1529436 RepID=UPI0014254E6F|nr:translin-associated protein X-like isoform X2 [Anneissia japonica]